MKPALMIAIVAACGRGPDASHDDHEQQPAPVTRDASAVSDAHAIDWPTVDRDVFLTTPDLAKACGVTPKSLAIKLVPLAEPTKDALGEDRSLYVAEVSRAAGPKDDHFMGIVVQVRETAERAAKLHASTAKIYTPITGTNLFTHRLAKSDWVRREIHGLHDRFVYSIYETDARNETVVCDDDKLVAIARLLETRLPRE